MDTLFIIVLNELLNTHQPIEADEGADVPVYVETEEQAIFTFNNQKMNAEFIKTLIEYIVKYKNNIDKLTYKNIIKNIDSVIEMDKESNLDVMQKISDETRRLKNTRLKLGIDKYQNLSKMKLYNYMLQEDEMVPTNDVLEHLQTINESNVVVVGDMEENGENEAEY
tara:strand:- start:345 stop:845 length:501 start_codon:yes stop_codon:yes gene_type:complete